MKNKLRILTLCLFLIAQLSFLMQEAKAVTANPHPVEFKQPDGHAITVFLKGDEKVHWAVTKDGYSLLFNSNGALEYATLDNLGEMVPSGIQASDIERRTAQELTFLSQTAKGLFYSKSQVTTMKQIWDVYNNGAKVGGFPTTGTRKYLIILANFNNTTPTYTQLQFSNFMNQFNYNNTGSFKDYWSENSYGQLTINSTVTVWVTLPNTHDYYGPQANWKAFALAAITAADPYVNYSQFDNDGLGGVDGIGIIHQGPGQEETGSTLDIWSHSSTLSGTYSVAQRTFDGVLVNDYTTQPEISGSGMSTIGVMCHEFGHNLGAYDFYDTDYATGGQYDGTGYWDLQASGSYNGVNGETPAHSNPWTKINVYGWATATDLGTTPQDVTVYNSTNNRYSFYKVATATANEYYLFENRQQIGFNAGVPGHGLLVYHVHSTMTTATSPVNAAHPNKMYIVSATSTYQQPTGQGTYGIVDGPGCPYPGGGNKTSFTDATTPWAKSWASVNTAKPITNITEITSNKTIVFRYMGGPACTLPTTQAIGFSASAITSTSMNISWARGNGNNVLVIARAAGEVNANPVNGTNYTANAAFGSGTQIGTGNYVVYNGTGTSVSVTGLTASTAYYYSIYEYTTTGYCYLQPGCTGNFSTTYVPTPPTVNFTENKTTILKGDSIEFTETCSNNTTSWQWTFNGGFPSTSTYRTPTVKWYTAGTYTVSLVASNSDGSNTLTKTNYITVNDFIPPATNPVTIGVGTAVSGYPLGQAVRWGMSASIYTAAEIGGSGFIDQLAWYTTVARATSRPITIKIKHTTATTLTADTWTNMSVGTTTVYTGNITNLANEWKTITLTTPFFYNGTDNLLVMVSVDNNVNTGSSASRYSANTGKHEEWAGSTTAPSTACRNCYCKQTKYTNAFCKRYSSNC